VPGGSIDFIYHCPKCKQELVSANEEVMQEEKCPYCNQSFAFDSSIKDVWENHVAEMEHEKRQKEREKWEKKIQKSEKEKKRIEEIERQIKENKEREKALNLA